jgi:membrane protein DedA with SNARE-associated domain
MSEYQQKSHKKGKIDNMASILNLGFQATVQWVLQHGYPLLFIVMLIEGPVVTAAGAFAAALHYMNVWIVLLLSILANFIPDLVYYAIGYWGRERFLDKYGHYFGITPERIATTEKLAEQHSGKSLFMIKMVPFLATPGLILVGATKMDIKKYAFWSIAIIIPSSLLYLIIGYYFGAAYNTIEHYLNLGIYVAIAAAVIVIAIAYFQRKYFARLGKKIETE